MIPAERTRTGTGKVAVFTAAGSGMGAAGRLPVAVRYRAAQPLAPWRPAPRHRGRGPGLVKENQPLRREPTLLPPPALTLRHNVRTRLFGRVREYSIRRPRDP